MRDRHRILLHRVNLSETCALFDGWVKILALRVRLNVLLTSSRPWSALFFLLDVPDDSNSCRPTHWGNYKHILAGIKLQHLRRLRLMMIGGSLML
jgi:hypothetical protein